MIRKKKFKKVSVPATTTNKQKSIINFLLKEGHSASRINTTGIWDEERKCFRNTGGRVGHPDISGVFKSRYTFPSGAPIGIAFYIEGKWTKGDKLSPEQLDFSLEVQFAGAFYLECETVEDFYVWYQLIKDLHL